MIDRHLKELRRKVLPHSVNRVIALILLLPACIASTQGIKPQPQNIAAPCTSSTVDDGDDAELAKQAKLFLSTMQKAVRSNDAEVFAALVQYPARVNTGKGHETLRTPVDTVRRYNELVSPATQRAVLTQSPNCTFEHNGQLMIGDGDIWFGPARLPGKKDKSQSSQQLQLRILSFNLNAKGK